MRNREFGVRLTRYRERQHLSITQLAAQAGVDYMQISRYEKGVSLPALGVAVRLAEVLDITLDELATGSTPEPPAFRNKRLFEHMRALDQLPADRQAMALRILDTVVTGYELERVSESLRRS